MILKQGEQKNVDLVVTYGHKPLDVRTATITMKACDKNNNIIFDKKNEDFSKVNGQMGGFSFIITATDTSIEPGTYTCYVQIQVGNLIDKTITFPLTIEYSPA